MTARRPPRLIVKALAVTFGTVALLLAVVFLFVRMSVRDQVRRTVTQNLEMSQRMLATLESRRLRELRTQAETLAENPTLKAAIDTYAAEHPGADTDAGVRLLATVQRELDKLSARVDTDAAALTTPDGTPLAMTGRLAGQRPSGSPGARLARRELDDSTDALVDAGDTLFRAVRVPLTLDDGATIGWLELGTALDARYAQALDRISRVRVAVVRGPTLVATTLTSSQAHDFQAALRSSFQGGDPLELDGASHAWREISAIGNVRIYALSSVDEAAAAALSRMNIVLAGAAGGAFSLALLGSLLLARLLSRPIEQLSGVLDQMAAGRELYQAAVRYERHAALSYRIDAGYIASPLGLGMLDMRADVNPTIQPHLSYFVPLLPFDTGAPMVGAIAASYPLGITTTASTARWDARAAVVNSAPTRRSAFNATRGNPDATPVLIAGGGVTLRPRSPARGGVRARPLRHRPGSGRCRQPQARPADVDGRGRICLRLHEAGWRMDDRALRARGDARDGVYLVRAGGADADAALVRGSAPRGDQRATDGCGGRSGNRQIVVQDKRGHARLPAVAGADAAGQPHHEPVVHRQHVRPEGRRAGGVVPPVVVSRYGVGPAFGSSATR